MRLMSLTWKPLSTSWEGTEKAKGVLWPKACQISGEFFVDSEISATSLLNLRPQLLSFVVLWLQSSARDGRKGDKFLARYLGPYEIVEHLGKNVFKICNPSTGLVVWSYIANDSDHLCTWTILHCPGNIHFSDILATENWEQIILSGITQLSATTFCFRLDSLAQVWILQSKVGNDHEFRIWNAVKSSNHVAKSKEGHFQCHPCLEHITKAKNSWVLTNSTTSHTMPSLTQLAHQMRRSGHPKGSFDEASNSMCIVEPPHPRMRIWWIIPSHGGSNFKHPVSFYANFFPEVPLCLLPFPIQLEQPPKLPATSGKALATFTKPPPTSTKPPPTSGGALWTH